MAWTARDWRSFWAVVKDIGLTGLGMVCIYTQITSSHPSGLVLGTGLALTVPSTWDHIKALLPSSGGSSTADGGEEPSSQQSLPRGPRSLSPQPLEGGDGDPHPGGAARPR